MSGFGMSASMAILGTSFILTKDHESALFVLYLPLLAMCLFFFAYAIGFNSVLLILIGEIYSSGIIKFKVQHWSILIQDSAQLDDISIENCAVFWILNIFCLCNVDYIRLESIYFIVNKIYIIEIAFAVSFYDLWS